MSRRKFSKEFKLKVLQEHREGASFYRLGQKYGIEPSIFRRWNSSYEARGEAGIEIQNPMLCRYTADFKEKVANDYLSGGGTYQDIAIKYGIHASSTVMKWVKMYNNHEALTDTRGLECDPMAKNNKARKTTLEERITIVEYCITHSCNYSLTANKYNCSYGQVNSWVRKYKDGGIEALYDRRGKKKPEEEMNEVEKLRAENRLLKEEKKNQQMEIDFLKKLNEIEGR